MSMRAPDRVRAPAPAPALRVVDPPSRRRHHVRRLVVLGAFVVPAVLFGVVAFHVVLNQAQGDLDRMQAKVTAERERGQRLRLSLADLQSPVRIVTVAREHLGMVPPAAIVYVTPGTSGPAIDPPPAAAVVPAAVVPAAPPVSAAVATAARQAAPSVAAASPTAGATPTGATRPAGHLAAPAGTRPAGHPARAAGPPPTGAPTGATRPAAPPVRR